MIYELIKNALVSKLGIEENLIKPDAYIEEDLELDSTETVVIALELKKHLGVDYQFPIEDVTLQNIIDTVSKLKAAL